MTTSPVRIAILAATYNKELVDFMVDAAMQEAEALGESITKIVRVPGAYEMPLVADGLLAQTEIDALVVLGFIERGETLHGHIMGQVVHTALMQLSLQYKKSIGCGIIGPGAVVEQAELRKDAYARAAVRATLASHTITQDLWS